MRAVRHKGEIARSTTVLNTGSSPTQYPPLPNAYYEATTEKQFQQDIIDAARLLGWLVYHVHDSRRCTSSGYPDLTFVHPLKKDMFMAELKSERGRIRTEQKVWLDALQASGVECYIWRPHQIDEIIARLQRIP